MIWTFMIWNLYGLFITYLLSKELNLCRLYLHRKHMEISFVCFDSLFQTAPTEPVWTGSDKQP